MGAAYGAERFDGLELLRERDFNIKIKQGSCLPLIDVASIYPGKPLEFL
jgi:hypothetical protein